MAALETPAVDVGVVAPDFELAGVDGKTWRLADCRGPNGTLVMFICNHCPYVKAVLDRIVRDTRELASLGVGSVGIMSNDTDRYPADSFAAMAALAKSKALPFPYVLDDTQDIARAYGAVCTPDFFGFDANLELRYRGRIDASGMRPAPADTKRELFDAMCQIAETGVGPDEQHASIGCSIKWRE
ncbi:MAG: thioredoxin family protein [Gammaproteobacteria bacterium]|nr:thioredoxin family protein [Gammaproteobacteria bacterium]